MNCSHRKHVMKSWRKSKMNSWVRSFSGNFLKTGSGQIRLTPSRSGLLGSFDGTQIWHRCRKIAALLRCQSPGKTAWLAISLRVRFQAAGGADNSEERTLFANGIGQSVWFEGGEFAGIEGGFINTKGEIYKSPSQNIEFSGKSIL